MPNILIEPSGPLNLKPKDCPKEKRIKNFSSRLFFFDHFILPNELLDTNFYLGTRPYREIFVGNEVEFLKKNELTVPVSIQPDKTIGEGCLLAKESIELGKLNPFKESERRPLENKLGGAEIFISERLAALNSNENPVLTIEFVDGIPIPHKSWSHDRILNFKSKHWSEYRRFWASLDLMAKDLEFLRHPEPDTQIRTEVIQALDEFAAKSGETFGTKLRDAISFDIAPMRTVGAMTAAAAIDALLAAPVASVTAGLAGIVRFKLNMKPSHEPMSQNARGMAYLSRIRKM